MHRHYTLFKPAKICILRTLKPTALQVTMSFLAACTLNATAAQAQIPLSHALKTLSTFARIHPVPSTSTNNSCSNLVSGTAESFSAADSQSVHPDADFPSEEQPTNSETQEDIKRTEVSSGTDIQFAYYHFLETLNKYPHHLTSIHSDVLEALEPKLKQLLNDNSMIFGQVYSGFTDVSEYLSELNRYGDIYHKWTREESASHRLPELTRALLAASLGLTGLLINSNILINDFSFHDPNTFFALVGFLLSSSVLALDSVPRLLMNNKAQDLAKQDIYFSKQMSQALLMVASDPSIAQEKFINAMRKFTLVIPTDYVKGFKSGAVTEDDFKNACQFIRSQRCLTENLVWFNQMAKQEGNFAKWHARMMAQYGTRDLHQKINFFQIFYFDIKTAQPVLINIFDIERSVFGSGGGGRNKKLKKTEKLEESPEEDWALKPM